MRAKPHNSNMLIKDRDGTKITDPAGCMRRWKDHFERLLNKPDQSIDPALQSTHPPPDTPVCCTDLVTCTEVRYALRKLKKGRAAGDDGIPAELLQCGGECVITQLTALINLIYTKEQIPLQWR